MAGHLLINEKELVGKKDEESKAIRKIIRNIRNDIRQARESDEELGKEYIELPSEYCDEGETSALLTHVEVPDSMVWGGKASIELHFRMSVLSKIYLVA
jgi:hypothetical protein